MLIDTHAHLTDKRYSTESDRKYENAEAIIANMQEDNLEKIICVGYDYKSSCEGLELAKKHRDVYCAVGIHPSETQDMADDVCDKLLILSKHEKVAAIGEIGLDYHYEDTDRVRQNYALIKQLELVKESKLPVIFHLRDAYDDMYRVIKSNREKIVEGAVMHCFSGSKETALQYIDMGFYISFSGSVTFKNAVKFPDIVRSLPLDRILIETDCPYLTPTPFRGQLNYPAYVKYQAERLAELKVIEVEKMIEITRENAYRFFGKMKK